MAIIEDFGQATLDGFKDFMPRPYTKDWNPFTNSILGYLFRVAAEKVTYVTDFTKQLVRGIIYTGRQDEASIDTIARDLDKGFEEFSTHRAYRIARTEVVAASNYGSQVAAEEAAEEVGSMTKEWIDSMDDRVRDKHRAMRGEVVGLYEKYSNGLMYPGDMANGSASDVIHCRCTQIYNPIAY
jgi:SPP1 gp7 family putative phage head morphogenesis protein